jgi:deazaflavin-dependent oxidoreductase (nitroreductase family)
MTTLFYKRPTAFRRRVYDPLMRTLILRLGFGGFLDRTGRDSVQVLVVRGRRTGATYRRPVGVSVTEAGKYVIGFYGHTQWSRNLRACPDAELHTRGRAEHVHAVEASGDEKVEFVRSLVARYRFFARAWLKVNPRNLGEADLQRLITDYPVFRLDPAAETSTDA